MCLPFRSSSPSPSAPDKSDYDDSGPLPAKKVTGRRTPEATSRIRKSHFGQPADGRPQRHSLGNPSGGGGQHLGGHVEPSGKGYGGASSGHDGAYGGLYGGVNGGMYGGVSGGGATGGGVQGGVNAGVYGTSHGGGDQGGYLS